MLTSPKIGLPRFLGVEWRSEQIVKQKAKAGEQITAEMKQQEMLNASAQVLEAFSKK